MTSRTLELAPPRIAAGGTSWPWRSTAAVQTVRPAAARRGLSRVLLVAAGLVVAAACTRSASVSGLDIRVIDDQEDPGGSFVEVTGIDAETRRAAAALSPTSDTWPALFDIRVLDVDGKPGPTPVAGRYTVAGAALRFTPLFPFDPGRRYEVRYFGSPAREVGGKEPLRRTISIPAGPLPPATQVTQVFPSAEVVPENQLRMYIHFSAPMGRRGGTGHVRLLDEQGREVPDPFLPLDAEFWNADRTRYTLFFDPGRQKRGIRPNRELGPSLVAGRRYTLMIEREWIDGEGHPLKEAFTRSFSVGAANQRTIDVAAWRISAPAGGTRDALQVDFPEPLDHGLLLRAVGVRRDGRPVLGDVRVGEHETRWTLTPSEPWRSGRYELIALAILEDLAGNQIHRAFEVDAFNRVEPHTEPPITAIPFTLSAQ